MHSDMQPSNCVTRLQRVNGLCWKTNKLFGGSNRNEKTLLQVFLEILERTHHNFIEKCFSTAARLVTLGTEEKYLDVTSSIIQQLLC